MLFCMLKFCLILNYSNSRGVFRTQSSIYDGAFCENSWRLSAVHYFHKNLHLRYSTGLWIVSFSEYFASLNSSSLCCINKEKSYQKQKANELSVDYRSMLKIQHKVLPKFRQHPRVLLCCSVPLYFWNFEYTVGTLKKLIKLKLES